MKNSILIIFALTLALLSQSAAADNRHNRGYGKHYDNGHYGHGYRGNHYYSYNYRPRVSYIGIGGGHYHHGHHSSGSFVGGLVLGSLLTYPWYNNGYYGRAPGGVTVVTRSSESIQAYTSGRRLLRDLEGRCFEITRAANGDEIRTELNAADCGF